MRAGDPVYARTIRRGGEQLTAAIAKAFNADLERAEQAKRSDAFLASPGRPATTPLGVKLDSVLREALAPTIRELRQTLASFRASNRFDVDNAAGGGRRRPARRACCRSSRPSWAFPPAFRRSGRRWNRAATRPADVAGEEGGARPNPTPTRWPRQSRSARSRGSREIDFRRGPFVYRASFSILRQKACTSPRWRARCCSRRASTSAPGIRA